MPGAATMLHRSGQPTTVLVRSGATAARAGEATARTRTADAAIAETSEERIRSPFLPSACFQDTVQAGHTLPLIWSRVNARAPRAGYGSVVRMQTRRRKRVALDRSPAGPARVRLVRAPRWSRRN